MMRLKYLTLALTSGILLMFCMLLYVKPLVIRDTHTVRFEQFRHFETKAGCPKEFIEFPFCIMSASEPENLVLGDSMQLGLRLPHTLSLGAGSCPLLRNVMTPNSDANCASLSLKVGGVVEKLEELKTVSLIHRSEYLDFVDIKIYEESLIEMLSIINDKAPHSKVNIFMEPPRLGVPVSTCIRRFEIFGKKCDYFYPASYKNRLTLLTELQKNYHFELFTFKGDMVKDFEILINCNKDQTHFKSFCQTSLYGKIL